MVCISLANVPFDFLHCHLFMFVSGRFGFHSRHFVAGVLEEDDPGYPSFPTLAACATPGRSFTLFLYDRERHQVR